MAPIIERDHLDVKLGQTEIYDQWIKDRFTPAVKSETKGPQDISTTAMIDGEQPVTRIRTNPTSESPIIRETLYIGKEIAAELKALGVPSK